MRIAEVVLNGFPPFADAILAFPPCSSNEAAGEVQLLTGENGTGKTRLLCLLAAACGNRAAIDSRIAAEESQKTGVVAQHGPVFGAWTRRGDRPVPWFKESSEARVFCQRGQIIELESRRAGLTERLLFPPVEFAAPPAAALAFRGVARVSEAKIAALAPVKLDSPAEHLTFEPAKNEDLIICQSMANLKMVAAMDLLRKSSKPQSRAIQLIERLENSVSQVTGREFSFDVTPHPEVRLRVFWGGVAMRLHQLPDGLRSVIGWLVSCVSKLDALFPEHPDPLSVPLILLLDEPEGHLHPAWQRKVLPAAQTLFPQAQIFVATHSPFVISSVNRGWIHVFRADDSGTVKADPPRECSRGDTYLDVVEDILGVKEWYDPETEELLAAFRKIRDAVLAGDDEFDHLATQARTIAERSASLRDLMAREMRQVERMQSLATSQP